MTRLPGLVKGKTVGIDATTLEANAAVRSIRAARHRSVLANSGVTKVVGSSIPFPLHRLSQRGASRPSVDLLPNLAT